MADAVANAKVDFNTSNRDTGDLCCYTGWWDLYAEIPTSYRHKNKQACL